jgi:MtN3 and saliva related transmembrane protein
MKDRELAANIIGYIGGCFLVSNLIPQILHTHKTKSAKDLSFLFLFMCLNTSILFLIYGILIYSNPLIISNTIVLFEGFILLYFRILYGKKEEIND